MVKRILTGIAGIPLLILLIYLGGLYFFAFTLVLNFFCLYEFYGLFEKKNYNPMKFVSIIISYLLIAFAYKKDFIAVEVFLLFSVLIITMEVFRRENKRNLMNPMISMFGVFYITIPFMLLNIMEYEYRMVIYIIVLIWLCDIFAYFTGKFFGKHPLTSISPKKTIEGAIGGFAAVMAGAAAFHFIQPEFILLRDAIISGVIIGIFGQVGDVFESLLKRWSGTKDSSNIIPGHGGVLDRFDSLLFVTPLIYVYFNFIAK